MKYINEMNRKKRDTTTKKKEQHTALHRGTKPERQNHCSMNFGFGWHSILYARDVSGVYCFSVFSVIFFFHFILFLLAFFFHLYFVFRIVFFPTFFAFFYDITAMCAELNMITAFKQLQFHTKLVTTATQ